MRRAALLLCLLIGDAALAQPVACGMSLAFNQPDGRASVPVWQDGARTALLFADTMNVNTDGTRRSYSVDDFWGERHAINNLCNAMSDACAGLNAEQLRGRRIATQAAKANGWPTAQTAATRISSSIVPFRNGRPCPEVDGFLVSATSLHRATITDTCDIANYANALSVPAIVLPKRSTRSVPTAFEERGAKVGDLAVVMSGDGSILRFAVVGDTGPSRSLGEISVALAADLLGKTSPPANYQEVRGRGEFRNKGWIVGRTFTLVLPRTKDDAARYMTRDRIEQAAAAAFQRWGGAARLNTCRLAYRR